MPCAAALPAFTVVLLAASPAAVVADACSPIEAATTTATASSHAAQKNRAVTSAVAARARKATPASKVLRRPTCRSCRPTLASWTTRTMMAGRLRSCPNRRRKVPGPRPPSVARTRAQPMLARLAVATADDREGKLLELDGQVDAHLAHAVGQLDRDRRKLRIPSTPAATSRFATACACGPARR